MTSKIKKVLITGVAGFIGFHTTQKFMDERFTAIGVDDLNDHYDPLIKRKRIEYLKKIIKNFLNLKK